MAKQRRGRPVNGILVLDKPAGQTSNYALQGVKRLYGAQKAGHTGSLDPLATGVLPICFGEATKFSQFLLDSDKAYRSTFALGVSTTTGDAEGEVLERHDTSAITEALVEAQLQQLRGTIDQVPSMYSALKHRGQPLYKLARQGVEVEREARTVTVHTLQMTAFREAQRSGDPPQIDVLVRCSKGTYVRSLAEDLGRALGCGAHVTALRRIEAGPFRESGSVTREALEALKEAGQIEQMDALLLPVDTAVAHLPAVTLAKASSYYAQQGQAVRVSSAPAQGLVRMYADNGYFLGIGEILEDGRVGPKRLIASAQEHGPDRQSTGGP